MDGCGMQQRMAADRSSVAQIEESEADNGAGSYPSRRQLLAAAFLTFHFRFHYRYFRSLRRPSACGVKSFRMGGYMPEGSGGGGRAARAGRYPPLASLVVSTIAAFSAVIVIAVLHSVRLCVRRRAVADADAAGAQPGADAVAPVPARQGPTAAARRAPVRLLPRLSPAALAAATAYCVIGAQRVFFQAAAAVPVLLRLHPPRPRALASPPRRRRRHHARGPRLGPRPRVHARDHHRRRDAPSRGPLLRVRPEPHAVHGVEPPAADASAPGPRPGRGPHVRLHGPARHQPHGARRRGGAAPAAAVPVLHHARPPRRPVPGLVLLGLAGDAHRAVEPRVQEHPAGRQEGAVAGAGAHGLLEGQPRRGLAAPPRPPRLQRHQPLARRDHAPELGRGGEVGVPELEAVEPVHAPVQDLRGGVRVVGEPQVHPLLRLHGAAHRPDVPGLLQQGAGAAGEPPAGERPGHVRVHPGRRRVGQRAPGRGRARRAARAAADAGPRHGRRLRLHAPPAHRVRQAAGLPAGGAAHGAGGLRRLRALPRRRAPEEVPGGVRHVAGHRRAVHIAAAASRRLTDQSEAAIE